MHESTIGRGSGGNVIAALASLVIPGLGQLAQGRIFSALLLFVSQGFCGSFPLDFSGGWVTSLALSLDRGPVERSSPASGHSSG